MSGNIATASLAYSALHVPSGGGQASLALSGAQKFDGSESFSIGLWIRLVSATPAGSSAGVAILSRSGAFALTLVPSNTTSPPAIPAFAFGSQTAISAAWALSPGIWHHIWIDYATGGGGTGTIGLFIDGAPALVDGDEAQITYTGAADNGAPVLIGTPVGTDLPCDILAATFYSATAELEMTPEYGWAAPNPNNPTLVAAVDFSAGKAQDISAFGHQVTLGGSAALNLLTPTASFAPSANGMIQTDPLDAINPGSGAQPFTVMVRFPTISSVSNSGPLISNQGSSGQGAFALAIEPSGAALQVTMSYVPQGGTLSHYAFTPSSSPDVAVTYDGTNLIAYTGGQAVGTVACGALAQISTPAFTIGAIPSTQVLTSQYLTGSVQRVAVWNSCLSAADVATYTAAQDLSESGCLLDAQLLYSDPGNIVSGRALQVSGSVAFAELVQPLSQVAGPAISFARRAPVAATQYVTPSSRPAMLALKAKLPSGAVDPGHLKFVEAGKASFEGVISNLPTAQKARLRKMFASNIESSFRLAAANASLPGQVSLKSSAASHEIWFQDPTHGPTLMLSMPTADVSKYTAWVVAIILQCIVIVCDVLLIGIVVSKAGSAILRAITDNRAVLPRVQAVINVKDELVDVQMAINIVKAIYQAGALGNVVTAALAKLSWWNWAFTVASAVISICALFLTGGAYLAVVCALVALDVAKLVTLILDPPAMSSQDADERTAAHSPISAGAGRVSSST